MKLAVLAASSADTSDYLLYYAGRQKIPHYLPKDWRAFDILEAMMKHDFEQVWVTPGAEQWIMPKHLPEDWPVDSSHFLWRPATWSLKHFGDEYISSVHGYSKVGSLEERKLRSIIWPEHSGWKWKPGLDAEIMLAGLNNLQAALQCTLSSSPGATGRNFAVASLQRIGKAHWLENKSGGDLQQIPFKEAAKDLAWKTNLGDCADVIYDNLQKEAPGRWYVHVIDKNSQYLSAATGQALGIGQVIHVPEEMMVHQVIPGGKDAGFYRITATCGDPGWHYLFDGKSGPDPLYGRSEDENRQEWVTAPLLKLLYDLGWNVAIHEYYSWPESRRILEVPASELWSTRAHFAKLSMGEAEQFAYEQTKRIATAMVGMFAASGTKEKKYYRPDIWATIVEGAKARLIYNIRKIAEETGNFPIGVLTDALYYLSQEADIKIALGSIMNRQEQLGGFKRLYSLEVDLEVAGVLAAANILEMSAGLKEIHQRKQLRRY